MKRSEINALIEDSMAFFDKMHFKLPQWAYRTADEWKKYGDLPAEIRENMLGWDITDFGRVNFDRCGLILFTLRNGTPSGNGKTYAEKIMIARENQETPMHFHWKKMEDIINRGGGKLVMELYASTRNEKLSRNNVKICVDGIERVVKPGGRIVLNPGESICLKPGVYHRFYGRKGAGKVLVGEVSAVNDDISDNRFLMPAGRFPGLQEDIPPKYLLVSDYKAFPGNGNRK